MRNKIIILFFIVLISFGVLEESAIAKENREEGRFKNITIDNGLSQGTVLSIFQDGDGYMWFGTNDGLNRYNGYNFEIFKGTENKENTIHTGLITAIEAGDRNEVWVGTSSGLSKISREDLKVERFESSEFDRKKISNPSIRDIFKDSEGDIWIGTERGLNKYNGENGEFIKYFNEGKNDDTLSSNGITQIIELEKGKLLIGTENGLNILNKKSGKVKKIAETENKEIISLYRDDKGNSFFSSTDGKIGKYRVEKDEVDNLEWLNKSLNGKDRINSIIEDLDGNLIIGTTKGLIKVNLQDKTIIKYKNKYYDSDTLVNDSVQSLYRDRTGIIWVGTYNGISIFNSNPNFKHYKKNPIDNNSLSGNSILGMFEDTEKGIWIGTGGDGLNYYDRESEKFTHYKAGLGNKELSNNIVLDIEGNKDYIWIATKNGLNILNKKTKEIEKNIVSLDKKKTFNKEIQSLYLYENKYLWIGGKDGLQILNIENRNVVDLEKYLKKKTGGEIFVRTIFRDSKGDIWIGMGWNGGLIKIDIKNKKVKILKNDPNDKNTISNNAIKGINEDLDGNIWVTTSEGINKINNNTYEVKRYDEKDGLINNYTYGILVDRSNNIWISSNGGISKFNTRSETFLNYTYLDGTQSNEFNGGAELKTRDGKMFFGGINGISSFYPEEIKEEFANRRVSIGKFEVFNREEPINWEKIILNHNENTIAIEYFIPEYIRLGKWNYEYMLEGFDKEWNSSKERNYVRYTNLEPGRYTFKVKGNFGGREEGEITRVSFVIKKPWYKTTLAYISYVGIVLIIIILTINRVKILKKLVRDRTEKLNKELVENEKLYKELLRLEKLRNTYLVNLSHELRTPLNVILSSVQLIKKLNESEQIEKESLKKYMKIIDRNSKGLLKVINDLIDSSKINSGVYKLKYEKTDIVYLVEEIALSMSEYIKSNGLELVIDPEIEEKEIECSVIDIERCVINLISNAIKFTEEGKIYIGVKDLGEYVEILVEDSGVGISKEHQSMIFDRFATLETGISSKHCSSGIGLTLVKNLVELHGGSITLRSILGVGSTFIIKLPVTKK